MTDKFKVEEEENDDKDEFVFKVYMPNDQRGRELKNELISYAKLHCDNKVWRVLEQGMNLIMDSEEAMKIDHERRIKNLEKKLEQVLNSAPEEKKEKPKTLGGEKNDR